MSREKDSKQAVAFAVLLAGVICIAVGVAKVVRVYSVGDGPSLEAFTGLGFLIVGLLVSLERIKRDIVGAILEERSRDQDKGSPGTASP